MKIMGDRWLPNYSDSDSDDSPVYVARDPRKDKHFDRKQELLWNCKRKVGQIGSGKQPLTIAVIGPPGGGKSSFLNTVFAAFSNDHWSEYAKYGHFGRRDRQVTRRLKSFTKRDYYKENDDYLMPTFLDMTGLEDVETDLNKELLNIVICGKLKEGESLFDVIRFMRMNGVNAVRRHYCGGRYFGIIPEIVPPNYLSRMFNFLLIPNRPDYHRVNRIIVVCSANPDANLPKSLLEIVSDVTTRERDITLYGVLTNADRYKSDSKRVREKEKTFMELLGIPKTRFARIKNYCPDIDPNLTYEDTIIPSLDVPVLRLMRQVFTEEPTDQPTSTAPSKIDFLIFLVVAVVLFVFTRALL